MTPTSTDATTATHRAVVTTVGVVMAVIALLFGTFAGATPAEAATVRSSSKVVAGAADEALASYAEWLASRDGRHLVQYEAARDRVAAQAAAELGLEPAALQTAWHSASRSKQLAVLAALTQLGVPYRRNTSSEGVGFDCSGLTTYAWGRAGLSLTRQSRAQMNEAAAVDRSEAQAGDLAYYPGHVMLYLGVGDAMVHSPQPGQTVEMTFFAERRADRIQFADPTR
jgi:cell wall-associated NlpC family hydrolase